MPRFLEYEFLQKIRKFLKSLKYENKNTVSELLNPYNFFLWLIVSFKDIF